MLSQVSKVRVGAKNVSVARNYVVRATITSPLPKDSPLRNGTVKPAFSKEYQNQFELSELFQERTSNFFEILATNQSVLEQYQVLLKKEGVDFYDALAYFPKDSQDYFINLKNSIQPTEVEKYLKQLQQDNANSPDLEKTLTQAKKRIEEAKDQVQVYEDALSRRQHFQHVWEDVQTRKNQKPPPAKDVSEIKLLLNKTLEDFKEKKAEEQELLDKFRENSF